MKPPYRSSRAVGRRPRRLTWACAVAVSVLAVTPVWALRAVQVYVVTVRGASAATVVTEGMREALVRATGRRDAPADPRLAPLLQNAAQYLKGSRALSGGAIQVDFDAAAVAQAIAAAGVTLWDSKRPFILVALNPVPTGPSGDALRVQLEQSAEARGLPVSLVPLALADANGTALADEVVLQSAQGLGADAVLIGRADAANPGQWQWHLVSGYTSEGWGGDADAGINGAADSLASLAITSSSKPLVQVSVQVTGVSTLTDYARVEQLLRSVPGVQSTGLAAAQGTQASFTLGVRGGGETLAHALAGSAHLNAAGYGETQVQLNYTP